MRRAHFAALLALSACVDSPSYDGRVCSDFSPCPDGYACSSGFCQRACEDDDACTNGNRCVRGVCSGPADSGVTQTADANVTAIDGGPSDANDVQNSDGGESRDAQPSDAATLDAADTDANTPVECSVPADCDQPGPCEIAAGVSCESGRCRYPPKSCTTPPPSECVGGDTIFRNYSTTGRCEPSTDECEYSASEINCPSCRASCLAPCESVACDEWNGGCRSEAFCQPGAPGQLPQCIYTDAPNDTTCALNGGGAGVCNGGTCVRCTAPAHCDDGDRCTTDSCSSNLCSNTPNNGTAELCNNFDDDCDGNIDDNLTRACSTTCGSGVETCSAGVWRSCTAPQPQAEICDGRDNNCNGSTDEIDCQHEVFCAVFDDGYANQTGTADAIFSPAANTACIPGGANGICRRWLGRCVATGAADGHTHTVQFRVFDDGYSNITGLADAILIAGATSACIPGGATGLCRRWFGRGETNVVQGHGHSVWCTAFEDGYAAQTGQADAILWNGSQFCVPGGPNGICRRWFGRCVTR